MENKFLECPYCMQPLHYYSEYADAEVEAKKVFRYIRCGICGNLFTAVGKITTYYTIKQGKNNERN